MLDAAGYAFDGFQTRQGITFSTTGRDSDGDHFMLRAVGTTINVLPSANIGIFDVTCPSYWYSAGNEVGASRTDWTGRAAVLVWDDSAFVDLAMKNDVGGTTTFTASGPLADDGTFSLAMIGGSTLSGSLRAGLLAAEFRDQRRDSSSFRGRLRAVRR